MRGIDIWSKEREQAKVLENGLKVMKYEKDEKFYLKMWKPKGMNPYVNYCFQSNEKLDNYIQEMSGRFDSWIQIKKERRVERSSVDMSKVKIGDILYSSWGYDQTNIDFYQVVEKKNKSVVIRQIASKITDDDAGCMSNYVQPVKDHFIGTELMKRICNYGNGYSVSISSYQSASLHNGNKLLETHYA